jgi:diguanylate cyclase (GGDEF)-like protein
MPTFSNFIETIKRHPLTSAFDLSLAIITMAMGITLALVYDLEAWWSDITPRERTICSEELAGLILLFLACATIFIWRRWLEERQDRSTRHLAESALQEQRSLAMADPLTGLPNRREFLHILERTKNPTILLLDLNGFKAINDKHGHATGDDVLKVVASRFRSAARSEDVVARLGGDEFAVIAPTLGSAEDAQQIALRFIRSLTDAIEIHARSHFVGVAIGIAMAPRDGASTIELLRNADLAMYHAKGAGVSNVSFFSNLQMETSR